MDRVENHIINRCLGSHAMDRRQGESTDYSQGIWTA